MEIFLNGKAQSVENNLCIAPLIKN